MSEIVEGQWNKSVVRLKMNPNHGSIIQAERERPHATNTNMHTLKNNTDTTNTHITVLVLLSYRLKYKHHDVSRGTYLVLEGIYMDIFLQHS